ncbi:hypothetical protein AC792_08960, partial [Arthrobacter sp. RIT-PI-e]
MPMKPERASTPPARRTRVDAGALQRGSASLTARSPRSAFPNPARRGLSVGVDIGGTKVAAGVVDVRGTRGWG